MTTDERVRVEYLQEKTANAGWRGPGWYFYDPSDRRNPDGRSYIAGPYSTEDIARRECVAYCECMTI